MSLCRTQRAPRDGKSRPRRSPSAPSDHVCAEYMCMSLCVHMCISVCLCVCVHVWCVCTCVPVCLYACICVCTHVCLCTYIPIFVASYLCLHACVVLVCVCVCMHTLKTGRVRPISERFSIWTLEFKFQPQLFLDAGPHLSDGRAQPSTQQDLVVYS